MSKHRPVIGLCLPLHSEIGMRRLRGIVEYAEEHPEISLADFCFTENVPVPPGPPVWTGKVDGMVMGVAYDRQVVGRIESGGVPTVNASADLMDTTIVSVFSDPESWATTAVDHLHGLGYRNFLYVGVGRSCGSRHYRDALSKGLKLRGCRFHAVDAPADRTGRVSIERCVTPRLRRLKRPLAIIALTDLFAAPIASLAGRLRIRIPEEVGILGVGDTAAARISSPPISTIRVAQERIGYEAARLVHRMIEGRRLANKNLSVPGAELIARASTVPKRRSNGTDVRQALALVRERACEGIKIPEVAAQLHMSVRALELQFAAEVGHSVGEELRQVRLQRAKELLLRPDLSLTRISSLIGYSTSAYFTRFFQEHTGQTPSEYRRQRR